MSPDRQIYVMTDVVIVEEKVAVKKSWFGESKAPFKTEKFLINATIQGYNHVGSYMGKMSDEGTERFLRYHDLDVWRENWRNFKKELEAFGFIVIPLSKSEKN